MNRGEHIKTKSLSLTVTFPKKKKTHSKIVYVNSWLKKKQNLTQNKSFHFIFHWFCLRIQELRLSSVSTNKTRKSNGKRMKFSIVIELYTE